MDRSLVSIVVATASGAPMRSSRPKPLHLLCGRPMVAYVLDALAGAAVTEAAVVAGREADRLRARVSAEAAPMPLRFTEQTGGRGMGHATLVGLTSLDDHGIGGDEDDVVVIPSDVPLIRAEVLQDLLRTHAEDAAAATLLTAELDDPGGHPRITRDRRGRVAAIVADADVIGEERSIREVSLGVMVVRRGLFAPALRRGAPRFGGEHRLIDVVEVLAETGHPIATHQLAEAAAGDLSPVDSRRQLADAESELRRRTNDHWLDRGVTMVDPSRTYIDATVRLGTDVTLFPGTMLQGDCVIGDGAEIGPDTRLVGTTVGRDCVIEKAMATDAAVGDGARVGPFAVLHPGSSVKAGAVTGPFYAADGPAETSD